MCYRTSRSFLPNFVSNAGVTAGCCRDGLMLQSSGRDDDEDGGLELSRKHCHVAAAARAPHLSSKEEQSSQRQQWQRFGRRCAHPARRGGRRGPRRRLRGHEEGAVSVGRTMLCRFDGPIEKTNRVQSSILSPPPPLSFSLSAPVLLQRARAEPERWRSSALRVVPLPRETKRIPGTNSRRERSESTREERAKAAAAANKRLFLDL